MELDIYYINNTNAILDFLSIARFSSTGRRS